MDQRGVTNMFRVSYTAAGPRKARRIGLLLTILLLLVGWLGIPLVLSQELGLTRRKLTIGGALVDALA
ncbi:MAG: hypothetical protein ACE5KY_04680, partial [Candidatus Tectimicrobiota bacterium]